MALLLAPLPPTPSSRLSSSASFSFFRSSFNGEFPLKCFHLKKENRCLSIKKLTYLSCRSSWAELAGVLIFSAIPFTAVKAISNSSVGEMLRKRMLETKNSSVANSSKFKAMTEKARKESFEILHARWAMLASLGAVIPEILNLSGAIRLIEPVWWRVGYAKLQGDTLDYLGIPGLHIAGGQGVVVIAICQALLMVGPEYARYCGIEALEPLGIYLPGDINYPGGTVFDPLGLSRDPVAFEELKVKEIKNGRLAMVAWLGFYLQAAVTGKGPVQNLTEHISDPFHNNLLSYVKDYYY